MEKKEEYKHITVRMPAKLHDKLMELARMHHRDRTGEIIHACAVYVEAHSRPGIGMNQELQAIVSAMIAEEIAKYDIRRSPDLHQD